MLRLVLALLMFSGCGSVCGDGKVEGDEQCDDGNTVDGDGCSATCRAEAPVDTFVQWEFLVDEFPGFDSETCLGLDVASVQIALSGPKTLTQTADCSLAQIKLSRLPAGEYTVSATALDGAGHALTQPRAIDFSAGTTTRDVIVNFQFQDFLSPRSGAYYFKVTYGGTASCTDADPPVARERVRIERDGVPLSGTTSDGLPIDGSSAGDCHSASENIDQAVASLPWGLATITVTGEDEAGTVLYRTSADTFVGAGVSNPTMSIDAARVVPLAMPDAGAAD